MAQDPMDRRPIENRDIVVRRGGGGRVWAWILFLVVVGFIVWVFVAGFGSPSTTAATPKAGAAGTQYQSTNPAYITDPNAIANATDANQLVGRDVQFQGAKIQGVTADGGFWVGASNGKGVFVVRKNATNPKDTENGAVKQPNNETAGGPAGRNAKNLPNAASAGTAGNNYGAPPQNDVSSETANRPDISIGQTVNVTGKIEKVPDTETAHLKWGVSGDNARLLEQEKVYVSADSVTVAGH